jgi:catechol 2,3-dioxygenase-like lactoylglutathione lyase family enzyme
MELSEITTFTDNVQGTRRFFEELLEREPVFSDHGIAIFDTDGVNIMIHETYDPEESELPPENHVSFTVDNLEEEFARLSESGLAVFREPAEYDWGRSAYLRSPDGTLVEIAEK